MSPHTDSALDRLLAAGLVSEEAAREIRDSGEVGVWRVLLAIELGADQDAVADTLAEAFGAPRLQLTRAWPDAADLVEERLVKLRYCAPLRELPDGRIALAMVDPSDRPSIEDVRHETRRDVVPMTVSLRELEALWQAIYPPEPGFRGVISNLYLKMSASDDEQAHRLLTLLLLPASTDDEPLVIDWSAETIDITGLCADSTRASDTILSRSFTERLRAMTDSPRPASLGGLTLHISRDSHPAHFLVHFGAQTTAVEPVPEVVFQAYF